MKKVRIAVTTALIAVLVSAAAALAQVSTRIVAQPFIFDPNNTGGVAATIVSFLSRGAIFLAKTTDTSTNAYAGVNLIGVQGTTFQSLSFDVIDNGFCSSLSPRFILRDNQGVSYFFACSRGVRTVQGNGWTTVRFTAANSTPVLANQKLLQPNAIISSIRIVFDQGDDIAGNPGSVLLSRIRVNDQILPFIMPPSTTPPGSSTAPGTSTPPTTTPPTFTPPTYNPGSPVFKSPIFKQPVMNQPVFNQQIVNTPSLPVATPGTGTSFFGFPLF